MRTIEQEDLDANASLFQQQQITPLLQRFSLETNRDLSPPDQYCELMRGLNIKQRQIVNFHRRWCKNAVIAMKKGEAIKPYRVFLSGPGGVGKSYVISLIRRDSQNSLVLYFIRLRECCMIKLMLKVPAHKPPIKLSTSSAACPPFSMFD